MRPLVRGILDDADAEIAVMGAESAVRILHRKKIAAAAEQDRDALVKTWRRSMRASPAVLTARWRSASLMR